MGIKLFFYRHAPAGVVTTLFAPSWKYNKQKLIELYKFY